MIATASFSSDRAYRYVLRREWGMGHLVAFVGLNPSTADETEDDPTIRRAVGFARSWGYAGIVMLNLFAVRATDPRVMKAHPEPVGEKNDACLRSWSREAGLVVACWGAHGAHLGRGAHVRELLSTVGPVHTFGLTAGGQPKHPLYLPKAQPLEVWS